MLTLAFISDFFDLEKYTGVGIDASVYFFMATSSSLMFSLRLGLQLFFGLDGGGGDDFDFESGEIDAHVDSTGAFSLFSLLSILAFFMGTGWMGLTCRVSWEIGPMYSAFAAAGFGFALMMMSSGLLFVVKKMAQESKYDVKSAVGATGKVYSNIPAKGEGFGQVEVNVSGRRKIMNASSTGDAIESFTAVKVVASGDDETLVVEAKA